MKDTITFSFIKQEDGIRYYKSSEFLTYVHNFVSIRSNFNPYEHIKRGGESYKNYISKKGYTIIAISEDKKIFCSRMGTSAYVAVETATNLEVILEAEIYNNIGNYYTDEQILKLIAKINYFKDKNIIIKNAVNIYKCTDKHPATEKQLKVCKYIADNLGFTIYRENPILIITELSCNAIEYPIENRLQASEFIKKYISQSQEVCKNKKSIRSKSKNNSKNYASFDPYDYDEYYTLFEPY